MVARRNETRVSAEDERINKFPNKFHISKQPCIVLYFINLLITRFDEFPKISDHFPKILKMLSCSHMNVSEHFPNFSKNFQRLPRKIRRCFDLISINLGPLSIVPWQTMSWLVKNDVTRVDTISIHLLPLTDLPISAASSVKMEELTWTSRAVSTRLGTRSTWWIRYGAAPLTVLVPSWSSITAASSQPFCMVQNVGV